MMARWAALQDAKVLVAGCGLGLYARQIRQRYTEQVIAFDIERERVQATAAAVPGVCVAACEQIPFPTGHFDAVLSHEVLEHVQDDCRTLQEMLRVSRPGGRILLFCPNRWYPFETHGHYWRGRYHFGNTPLINYLPLRWRNRLAPHVRAYTARDLRRLLAGSGGHILHHRRIYGGYDNIIARLGAPAALLRDALQRMEGSPLDCWALSHFLVIERR